MIINGEENIPREGGIYLINHMAGIDVVIPFLAAFKEPIGVFTDMGNHFVVDILEKIGFVPRMGNAQEMVEKMIRNLLTVNKNFVMWPEGTPDKGQGVMQGFSSIVKVYATVNADKDRVPFVPVVMQGIDKFGSQYIPNIRKYCPKWDNLTQTERKKAYRKIKRVGVKRVIFTYLKPVYLPRTWLLPPEQGGKTPREIIDFLMLKIAHKLDQKTLASNPLLDHRKAGNRNSWH
jgi:1-acyl-sn-glycerol-3-phosphate acyltransferase